MQMNIEQSQLDALDKHLGALVPRYEAEAAVFSSLGKLGQEIAEQRLRDAEEVRKLWDHFLHV